MLTLNSEGWTFTRTPGLSEGELLTLAESLGPVLHWEFGPIMTMKYDTSATNYLFTDEHVPFHWDGAFYKEPKFLLFYCTESEGEGGETIFSDTTALWNSLTEVEKEECRRVSLTYSTEKKAHYGGTITVPLVQKHPVSGDIILRLAERVESEKNPVTLTIHGAGEDFYRRMTDKLHAHKKAHSWKKGDLLIVDNFRFLHGRNALGNNRRRTFKRIQIL